VAKAEKGPCVGVSREIAVMLYPYYGWGAMDVEAEFEISEAKPVEAARVVMKVPFGITETVVRRQLTSFPTLHRRPYSHRPSPYERYGVTI